MWVLKCTNNGKYTGCYVTPAGSEHSDSPDIRKAQRFATAEQARANACGNELVVHLHDELAGVMR